MKKVLSLLLSVALSLMCFVSLPDSAIAEESQDKLVEFTEDMAVEVAAEFAVALSGEDLMAGDPTKFFDTNDQPIGYIVDYYEGSESHGYVIFDNTDKSMVAQWSFGEGSQSPISAAVESVDSVDSIDGASTVVYKTSSFEYTAVNEETGDAVDSSGDEFQISEADAQNLLSVSTNNPTTWQNAFVAGAWWNNYIPSMSNNVPGGFNAYPEWWVEQQTGTYACAISALMVVSDYYCGFAPLTTVYPALWAATNTSTSYTLNGITYGSTTNGSIGSGFQSYAANRGRSVSFTQWASPSYSSFVSCVNRADISIFVQELIQ